jgi:hypothetical protein
MAKQSKKNDKALPREHWKDEPDAHDYPAAGDYLTLIADDDGAAALVKEMKGAAIVRRKAKDLLRASRLPLLPGDNPEVKVDLDKVRDGDRLSPVLLVRGSITRDVALTVADGYHRICASYHIDEDADIPCRMVELAERTDRVAAATAPAPRRRTSSGGRRAAAAAADGA